MFGTTGDPRETTTRLNNTEEDGNHQKMNLVMKIEMEDTDTKPRRYPSRWS